MKEQNLTKNYSLPQNFFPVFFSARAECRDMDELVVHMQKRFPGLTQENVAKICVSLERSILMDFQPTSSLDFQHELQKQYLRLQDLTNSVENIIKTRLEVESEESIMDSINPMLNILRVAKDYLKLILDAQKEFYNAKEMQNFMDTILSILSSVSPKMKERVLSALAEKKMPHVLRD